MNPADLRNATWESIQPRLQGLRGAVLATWRRHSPGTTAQLAARSGLSVLTFRPRTTELVQLGLLRLVDRDGTEGIYAAVPEAECRAAFEAARRVLAPDGEQTFLNLTT